MLPKDNVLVMSADGMLCLKKRLSTFLAIKCQRPHSLSGIVFALLLLDPLVYWCRGCTCKEADLV